MLIKKIKKPIIFMICFFVMLSNMNFIIAAKDENLKTPEETKHQNNLRLWYDEPANVNSAGGSGQPWERETLPIGNGNMGGLIFGGINQERVHFNEKTLWTGGPSQSRPNYDGGNQDTVLTQAELNAYRSELDDKSSTVFPHALDANKYAGDLDGMGSYQDFGDIYMDFAPSGIDESKIENYQRDLSIDDATATTTFTYKGVEYQREYFMSYPDQLMVLRITASEKGAISFDTDMRLNNGGLKGDVSLDAAAKSFTIDGTVLDNQMKFAATMKVLPVNGTVDVNATNKKIKIRNSDEVVILMSSETNYKNIYPTYRDVHKNPQQDVKQRLEDASEKGYSVLKSRHLEDYQNLFSRVDFNLGENAPNITTDALIQNYRAGKESKYLETLIFQYGRYLTIASSRGDLPSNLAGLWTIGNAAWNGDYHFNVNVQMNYWPVYSTNLAECGETFMNYMDSLREPGRVSAARSHGVVSKDGQENGFVVHTQNNPFGMTAPSSEQEYGWNVTGASWALQNVYDQYRFSKDKELLKDKIYPMLKEEAKFWDQYLWYSPTQDRLVVSPSFSAEHGPTANGTTYDQSLVWEAYKEAIEAAEILQVDKDLVKTWKEKQAQLNPILIGTDGEVKEWFEQTTYGKAKAGNLAEINVPNFYAGNAGEHRHSSHLIGLYPGTLINKDDKEVMAAAKTSLLQRGFEATGWSKAHKINMWARTGDGENTLKLIRSMISGGNTGILENLLDSHGGGANNKDYSIFQIDGNFGLTSGMSEMLLQSQLGYTQFLPSLPKAWSNGHINGLVARGNFTIDQEWKNSLADNFTVRYTGDEVSATFIGEYKGIKDAKVYKDGKAYTDIKNIDGKEQISFTAEKGAVYTIEMNALNEENLLEIGKALLKELHPDLSAMRTELETALQVNHNNLADVIQKVDLANQLYKKELPYIEKVYCLTNDKTLTYQAIDGLYASLLSLKTRILKNTDSYDNYVQEQSILQENMVVIDREVNNNVIAFSIEEGVISSDHMLTLSKHADAKNYTIRYILDTTDAGMLPTAKSPEYADAISLPTDKDCVVRAALFKNEQRVSEIFTKNYTINTIHIKEATTELNNWDGYPPVNMIDGDSSTRWASLKPIPVPCEFTLTFDKKEVVDAIRFDSFVSSANSFDEFSILYEEDGEFKKIYDGSKLASFAEGKDEHVVKTYKFKPVKTEKLKIVLKSFTYEPSFFEVQPLLLSSQKELPAGDATQLHAILKKAQEIDRKDPAYINADENLKAAFDYSIEECERVKTATQDSMDSRAFYLNGCIQRLGVAESNKTELEKLIADATLELQGNYTKDSLYYLRKELAKAKSIIEDPNVKQPDINREIAALQKVLKEMVRLESKEENLALNSGVGAWKIAETGTYYTTIENDTMTYTFTGTGVNVTGVIGPDHGIMKFTLISKDGTSMSYEVDCYAKTRNDNALLFHEDELEKAEYQLVMELVGRNSLATNQYIEYSRIQVRSATVEADVDTTVLSTLVEECNAIDSKLYTKESYKALQDAIVFAEAVLGRDTCHAEVKDMIVLLSDAKDALVKVETGDTTLAKSILKSAIDKANAAEESTEFNTLAPSVQALIIATRNAAQVVYDSEDATNTQCMDAWLKLANALQFLDFQADKDALLSLIKTCNNIKTEDYNVGVEEFKAALVNAQNVYDNANALQASIDEAYERLDTARAGLAKMEDTVDKTLLESLISSIIDHVGNGDKYKKDTNWAAFEQALTEAKAIVANTEATQSEVNGAFYKLSDAYVNIRLLPSEEQLAELNGFLVFVNGLNRKNYSVAQLSMIDETAEKVKAMINDFEDTKFASLQEEMVATLKMINDVIVDSSLKPGTNGNAANPNTGDYTNAAVILSILLVSGCAAILMRKKRHQKA